jgi:hypothetical protein
MLANLVGRVTGPKAIPLLRFGIGNDRFDRVTSDTLIPGSVGDLLVLSSAPQHQRMIIAD